MEKRHRDGRGRRPVDPMLGEAPIEESPDSRGHQRVVQAGPGGNVTPDKTVVVEGDTDELNLEWRCRLGRGDR